MNQGHSSWVGDVEELRFEKATLPKEQIGNSKTDERRSTVLKNVLF